MPSTGPHPLSLLPPHPTPPQHTRDVLGVDLRVFPISAKLALEAKLAAKPHPPDLGPGADAWKTVGVCLCVCVCVRVRQCVLWRASKLCLGSLPGRGGHTTMHRADQAGHPLCVRCMHGTPRHQSRFGELQDYLASILTDEAKVRSKLQTPLGVAEKLVENAVRGCAGWLLCVCVCVCFVCACVWCFCLHT
jgi:hypothetical protein